MKQAYGNHAPIMRHLKHLKLKAAMAWVLGLNILWNVG